MLSLVLSDSLTLDDSLALVEALVLADVLALVEALILADEQEIVNLFHEIIGTNMSFKAAVLLHVDRVNNREEFAGLRDFRNKLILSNKRVKAHISGESITRNITREN